MRAERMQLAERMQSSIVTINIKHKVENITIFKGAIKLIVKAGLEEGRLIISCGKYALIEINFTLKISFQCQHTSPQDIISLNVKHRREGNDKKITLYSTMLESGEIQKSLDIL